MGAPHTVCWSKSFVSACFFFIFLPFFLLQWKKTEKIVFVMKKWFWPACGAPICWSKYTTAIGNSFRTLSIVSGMSMTSVCCFVHYLFTKTSWRNTIENILLYYLSMFVEWLGGCFIVQSMAHAKTQVRIPLRDVHIIKIMKKKELWTHYRLPWNCDIFHKM